METMLRSRGISQPEEQRGPIHAAYIGSDSGSGSGSMMTGTGHGVAVPRHPAAPPAPLSGAAGSEELKALVECYRGFGMFSLIRALVFRGWRCKLLALLAVLLLVGQWAGPFGFIAFKIRMLELDDCPRDGGLWARFVITSVALIYTARLSVASLSHTLEVPDGFGSFSMPKWWEPYRLLDLVVESLLYDTTIFIFNLFIVFQDRSVGEMIVNVLALEFFTMIDDEFKGALLNYDSSFLDDMVVGAQAAAAAAAGAAGNGFHSAAARLEEGAGLAPSGEIDKDKRKITCVAAAPLAAMLRGIRLFCLVAGPLFSFFMIVYGPYCLGAPE